jgi:hypothetical protein
VTTDWSEVETILSNNSCLGCHGSSGGLTITFDNIVSVTDSGTGLSYIEPGSAQDSYLWHKINGTQSTVGGSGSKMGNISQTELDYIELWITEGAPQAPTWTVDVSPILSSCTGCHGNSGGLTINYNNIVGVTDSGTGLSYIEPGSIQNSYLWHKINGTQSTVGGSGSKMGNLNSTQLLTIENWIKAGALP